EFRAALLEQRRAWNCVGRVQRLEKRLLPRQSVAAGGAFVDMRLQPFFVLEGKLAVKKQRHRLSCFIAFHTKSPRLERIFCVARKRQFLAASSEVPNISPMALKRMPW